jgi:hypothetical protein
VKGTPGTLQEGGVNQTLCRPLSIALTLLVLSVFINYVDRGNLSIAAPLLKNELGISASQLGILLSAFFWTTPLCCSCAVGLWIALIRVVCWHSASWYGRSLLQRLEWCTGLSCYS